MRDGDVPSDSAASAKAHPIKRYIIICRLSCDILCPTTTTSTALCIVEFVNAERGRVSREVERSPPYSVLRSPPSTTTRLFILRLGYRIPHRMRAALPTSRRVAIETVSEAFELH